MRLSVSPSQNLMGCWFFRAEEAFPGTSIVPPHYLMSAKMLPLPLLRLRNSITVLSIMTRIPQKLGKAYLQNLERTATCIDNSNRWSTITIHDLTILTMMKVTIKILECDEIDDREGFFEKPLMYQLAICHDEALGMPLHDSIHPRFSSLTHSA